MQASNTFCRLILVGMAVTHFDAWSSNRIVFEFALQPCKSAQIAFNRGQS